MFCVMTNVSQKGKLMSAVGNKLLKAIKKKKGNVEISLLKHKKIGFKIMN